MVALFRDDPERNFLQIAVWRKEAPRGDALYIAPGWPRAEVMHAAKIDTEARAWAQGFPRSEGWSEETPWRVRVQLEREAVLRWAKRVGL